MALYTPAHFAGPDEQAALRLIREYPFATLITTVDGSAPLITHVPLLLEDAALVGHMARANPHWQAFAQGRSVALFHGPHAYISPRWYVEPAQHVPTWNYAVVHVHGQPQLLDAASVPQHVTQITEHFEHGAWAPTPSSLARLAPSVVGFRMPIKKIEAKFKLNQNRTAADRALVIEHLRASAHPDLAVMADWMKV